MRNLDSNGGFLQFAGLRVQYNYDNEDGHRVVSALVRCAQCNVPSYSNLNISAHYNIIVSEFLLNGGDGYVLTEENEPYTELLQKNDQFAFGDYLEARHYVYPENEGRIVIIGPKDAAGSIIGSVTLILLSSLITRFFN